MARSTKVHPAIKSVSSTNHSTTEIKKAEKKLPRYFVVPLEITPDTPAEIVFEALIRKPGDTYGVVRVREAGGIEFWNNGKKIGTFRAFKEVFDAADNLELAA